MTESGDEDVMIQANEKIPLLGDTRPEEDLDQELSYWQRLRQRRKRLGEHYIRRREIDRILFSGILF